MDITLPNTSHQQLILLFSISYFTQDTIFSIILGNYDYVFHHLLVLIALTTPLIIGYYSNTIIGLLFLGEITNPCQNLAWVLKQHNIEIGDYIFLIMCGCI